MIDYAYQGNELDLFQHAVNWKRYYASKLRPYIDGDVLEVGAGLGATSRFLCDGRQRSWTCLEPDAGLAERLAAALQRAPLPTAAQVVHGTLRDLGAASRYDTLLYIDVLEHIEDDADEIRRAATHLRAGGHLVVLSPAHNSLYSPFDEAIGHYRRYSKAQLVAVGDRTLRLEKAFYLDSAGMLASTANRAWLKSSYPTLPQIRFWDSTLVRVSRVLDRLLAYRVGKTVIAVWTRTPE
jgi:2-polyprenyl-3-methyl-5-hydroxy-6-metoxy-1,4-benzoquinol methylase